MRVLVATVAKVEELLRARRHLGYERLVVVVPQGAARLREALERSVPGAELVQVPDDDALACLERLEALFRAHARDEVRAAIDGGTAAMSAGAFLACLSQGVEAWFLLKEPVRLPVLRARPLERRLDDAQVAVLQHLEGRMAHAELARRAGVPLEGVRRVLIGFKRDGVVEADAASASLTALGLYLRRSLAPAR